LRIPLIDEYPPHYNERTSSSGYDARVRNATELRGEILSAARTEFAAYGLAGARIDRIARAAEASKERLYAHFGDKETLFREVVLADGSEFFAAVTLRPDAVPEFVGDIFDLAQSHPEHLRMITWARLEGVQLELPADDLADDDTDPPNPAHAVTAIKAAQASGFIDPDFDPEKLLVVLFSIGLAWANWPDPRATTSDESELAQRRAAAVEAARRAVTAR
jgi:AcrR family transcriptional regulator